jgi:hypothetical protein
MTLDILKSENEWVTSTHLTYANIEALIKSRYPTAVIPAEWQPDIDEFTEKPTGRSIKRVVVGQQHVATIRE